MKKQLLFIGSSDALHSFEIRKKENWSFSELSNVYNIGKGERRIKELFEKIT
jgi:hypothetical protein